jgi:hypothetical protein
MYIFKLFNPCPEPIELPNNSGTTHLSSVIELKD